MKKYIIAVILVVGLLLPQKAKAELDFLVDLIKGFENIQGEVSTFVQEYVAYQVKLQEGTTDSENLEKVKKIMEVVNKAQDGDYMGAALTAIFGSDISGDYSEFFNTKISNLQWPGLNLLTEAGEYTTPQNKHQVLLSYFKKSHVKDDLKVTKEKDEAIDNLTRENMAIDYANATKAVLELQEESKKLAKPDSEKGKKELKNSGEDLRVLENNYAIVMRRANHRWQDVVMFEASNISNVLKISANNVSVDELSETLGEDAGEVVENISDQVKQKGGKIQEKGSNGAIVDGVLDTATAGIRAISKKDYSGAFGSFSGMYANTPGHSDKISKTLSDVSTIISTGDAARSSVEKGKPEEVIQKIYEQATEEEEKNEKDGENETDGGNDNTGGK